MREDERALLLSTILPSLIKRRRTIRKRLMFWEEEHGLKFPWRTQPRTTYRVLVSEVLLRRTTSAAALRVFSKVISRYPTMKSFLSANLDYLEKEVASIGLRSQRRIAFASIIHTLRQRFRGKLPATYSELESIPHIGRYTAAAIMSFGQGIRMPLADSNVERIIARLFATTIGTEQLDNVLALSLVEKLLPRNGHELFTYGLLDLGARVCRYDRPRCSICPIRNSCDTGCGLHSDS